MSAGNAAACIGLVNTSKQLPLGAYVQDVHTNAGEAGPAAANNYAGVNGKAVYDHNVLGEAVGFTAMSNSGAAEDKLAEWVTNTSVLAAGTTKVSIVAGVATADNATGTHAIYFAIPTAGIPANSYFWAFAI